MGLLWIAGSPELDFPMPDVRVIQNQGVSTVLAAGSHVIL